MGLFDDAALDQDIEKLKEESQSVSPQTKPEVVPPSPQTLPSPSDPVEESTLADKVKESKDPDHWVPLPTFLEEKKERQRLEAAQRDMVERQARLDERYKAIETRLRPQESPPPDPQTDPLGHLQYQDQQQQQSIKTFQDRLAQFQQQQEQQQQLNALTAHVGQAETEFSKQHQDYYDAIAHVRQVRMAQYELAGLTPQEQVQALSQDSHNWAMALLRSGKNPAEATYELARKYGYQANANPGTDPGVRAASDENLRPASRNPDGTFAKTPNPKAEAAKATLKTVERGQQASKSIGNSAGSAVDEMPSPEELATMDEESFEKWTSGKNWKKYWAAQ